MQLDYNELSHLDTLALRLKYVRKFRDLSQVYIQEKTGIPQSAYSYLEKGHNMKSIYLPEIAKVLKVDLAWLLTGEIPLSSVLVTATTERCCVPHVKLSLLEGLKETEISNLDLANVVHFEIISTFPFPPEFFKSNKFDLDEFFVLQCDFANLHGVINAGNYFAISTEPKHQIINHGGYYAVVFRGEIMFVQIFKQGLNLFKLHSTSSEFFDLEVGGEEVSGFKVIGRICWKSGLI